MINMPQSKTYICNTPYFIELQNEYYQQKVILDNWHNSNSYADVYNSDPYPKECLYRMIDLLDIMDNVYSYAPGGEDYKQTRDHYLEFI